jgi:hypothetical protein
MNRYMLALLLVSCAVDNSIMVSCKTACAPLGISWVASGKCACNDPPKTIDPLTHAPAPIQSIDDATIDPRNTDGIIIKVPFASHCPKCLKVCGARGIRNCQEETKGGETDIVQCECN